MDKSQYKNSGEWKKACPRNYKSAYKQGFLDKICEHFGWDKPNNNKPDGYWNIKENVLAEARKYNTLAEWARKSGSSYNSANRNGWYGEATEHMTRKIKPFGYWDKKNVLAEAKKYKTIKDWRENSQSSINKARKMGWFDECVAHMKSTRKSPGYWLDKEVVLASARKYNTISHWSRKNSSSYQSAKKNGWFEECIIHMENNNRKPAGYWDSKENVLAEAKKYNTRGEWGNKSGSSYQSACKNGWYDECVAHMVEIHKPKGYWNIKENVLAEAKKYKSRTEWVENSISSYNSAKRNKWYEEATEHMKKRK